MYFTLKRQRTIIWIMVLANLQLQSPCIHSTESCLYYPQECRLEVSLSLSRHFDLQFLAIIEWPSWLTDELLSKGAVWLLLSLCTFFGGFPSIHHPSVQAFVRRRCFLLKNHRSLPIDQDCSFCFSGTVSLLG